MQSIASGAAPPTGQPTDSINFGLLKLHYQKQLYKFFEEKMHNKTLYIDQSLIKVLSFIMGNLPDSLNIKQKHLLTDSNIY